MVLVREDAMKEIMHRIIRYAEYWELDTHMFTLPYTSASALSIRDKLWQSINAWSEAYVNKEMTTLFITNYKPALSSVRILLFHGTSREVYEGITPYLYLMEVS